MMERETQTPPPPPMVSYCSFSERRSAPGGKQRAGNHGVHKYMVHVVAGPAQQLLQHTHGVLGLVPPRLGQSRAARAARSLPGAAPGPLPQGPRQSGSEGHVVKKVQLFFLLFCFLPIAASSSSDQGFISKRLRVNVSSTARPRSAPVLASVQRCLLGWNCHAGKSTKSSFTSTIGT